METTSSLKQPLFFQHVLRELLDAIGRVLAGDDPEADKRRRMLELSHSHPDGGSTRRLLEALGLLRPAAHGGFLHGRNRLNCQSCGVAL